jgi:hypothetical protein
LLGRLVAVAKEKNRWVLTINDTTGEKDILVHKMVSQDAPNVMEGISLTYCPI